MVFKNGKEFGEDSILKTEIGNEQKKKKKVTMAENEMTWDAWMGEGSAGRKSHKNASCILDPSVSWNWKLFECVSK